MIHPQPTSVLMLLWETQVCQYVVPSAFAAGELRPDRNPAQAFRILSARQAVPEAGLEPKPLLVRRRGPAGIRPTGRSRRPACLDGRPAHGHQ